MPHQLVQINEILVWNLHNLQVTSLSFYRFQDGTFDDFLEAFLTGCLPYGCYFEHLVAGYSLKDEPNVLFLTYEELQRDIREVVIRLASFIGERFGKALKENGLEGQRLLDLIIRNSSAESMKKIMVFNFGKFCDQDADRRLRALDISTNSAHEGDVKRHGCVGSCVVGKWKEYFSSEQLRRMETTIRKKTKGSSVMNLWRDIRAEALRLSREKGTPATLPRV
ncbi:amine sulfotransferase [Rhipicephalus sanguineus]|uniref:amine sulfotransferase n=1 Tax=Rhipicephalus sanguineus TaxID=34632 RepID=UPI0020C2C359|nr:amine sulfotransferase [Rhipicephalus sanguineus]